LWQIYVFQNQHLTLMLPLLRPVVFLEQVVLVLKHSVHDIFHVHHDHHEHYGDETVPLVRDTSSKMKMKQPESVWRRVKPLVSCVIPHGPTRAGVSGTLAGALVGTTCMFIPHVMFWGEAQLQNIIDKGRTPLPIFGHGDDPSAGLVALGYCIIDHESPEQVKSGFSIGCSAAITLAKIFVTGLRYVNSISWKLIIGAM
jgi:hypothetical protein